MYGVNLKALMDRISICESQQNLYFPKLMVTGDEK